MAHFIFYSVDGKIQRIGPFTEESAAMDAAIKAQEDGVFDILENHVYLVSGTSLTNSQIVELQMNDLGVA